MNSHAFATYKNFSILPYLLWILFTLKNYILSLQLQTLGSLSLIPLSYPAPQNSITFVVTQLIFGRNHIQIAS